MPALFSPPSQDNENIHGTRASVPVHFPLPPALHSPRLAANPLSLRLRSFSSPAPRRPFEPPHPRPACPSNARTPFTPRPPGPANTHHRMPSCCHHSVTHGRTRALMRAQARTRTPHPGNHLLHRRLRPLYVPEIDTHILTRIRARTHARTRTRTRTHARTHARTRHRR